MNKKTKNTFALRHVRKGAEDILYRKTGDLHSIVEGILGPNYRQVFVVKDAQLEEFLVVSLKDTKDRLTFIPPRGCVIM